MDNDEKELLLNLTYPIQHPIIMTKMAKINTLFRTQTAKNHTLWGFTYLFNPHQRVPSPLRDLRRGAHVKFVLMLPSTAFLPISRSVTFQASLNLYAYNNDHRLAVLCKFLGDFWTFWERAIFSQRIGSIEENMKY